MKYTLMTITIFLDVSINGYVYSWRGINPNYDVMSIESNSNHVVYPTNDVILEFNHTNGKAAQGMFWECFFLS